MRLRATVEQLQSLLATVASRQEKLLSASEERLAAKSEEMGRRIERRLEQFIQTHQGQ